MDKIYVTMHCKTMNIMHGSTVTPGRWKMYEVSPRAVLDHYFEFPDHSMGIKKPGGSWYTPRVEGKELRVREDQYS